MITVAKDSRKFIPATVSHHQNASTGQHNKNSWVITFRVFSKEENINMPARSTDCPVAAGLMASIRMHVQSAWRSPDERQPIRVYSSAAVIGGYTCMSLCLAFVSRDSVNVLHEWDEMNGAFRDGFVRCLFIAHFTKNSRFWALSSFSNKFHPGGFNGHHVFCIMDCTARVDLTECRQFCGEMLITPCSLQSWQGVTCRIVTIQALSEDRLAKLLWKIPSYYTDYYV